ncbi:SelB C-terminal domain-containing protein [Gemmatimonadota bacterium]
MADSQVAQVDDSLFSWKIWQAGGDCMLASLGEFHRKEPLRPGKPLEELRQVLPGTKGPRLAEALIQDMERTGSIILRRGLASLAGFEPTLSPAQESLCSTLRELLAQAALAPPTLRELEQDVLRGKDPEPILRFMEAQGEVVALEDGLFLNRTAVNEAGRALVEALSGAKDLGPADFREVFPLSRKHLLPLLRHFDTVGITTRREERRSVARAVPDGWGTTGGG